MQAVGLSQLKSRLGQYVRQVGRGKELLITDRGAVVAMLARPTPALPNLEAAIASLSAAGELQIGSENSPSLYPHQPKVAREGLAQALLTAERGEP